MPLLHANVCVLAYSELDAKKAHVYSYTKSFNAFAAKLSESEARELSGTCFWTSYM